MPTSVPHFPACTVKGAPSSLTVSLVGHVAPAILGPVLQSSQDMGWQCRGHWLRGALASTPVKSCIYWGPIQHTFQSYTHDLGHSLPLESPAGLLGAAAAPLPTVLLPRSCRWWLSLTPSDVGDPTSPRHLGTWALGPLRRAGWEVCPRTMCREVMKTAGGTPHFWPRGLAQQGGNERPAWHQAQRKSALGGHLGALAVPLEGTHCPVPGGWVGSQEERTVTEPAPCGGAAVGGEGAASAGTE